MRINKEVLDRIMEAQKSLDQAILTSAGITEYPLEAVTIAYNVELAELAQEWKGFKYWKKTKGEVDRSKLIEEYADCLHFAVSLTNYYVQVSPAAKRFLEAFILNVAELEDSNTISQRFIKCFDNDRYFDLGATILIDTLRLGAGLGFTFEEIEEAYFKKNKVNWNRLNSGY